MVKVTSSDFLEEIFFLKFCYLEPTTQAEETYVHYRANIQIH